jgi:hypothetical protein
MPETLFECAGPRLAGQTSFTAGRRKIPTPEDPLDQLAGFPVVRPYEARHMSSFPAFAKQTRHTGDGHAGFIVRGCCDPAASARYRRVIFIAGGGTCAMSIYRENRIQESEFRIQEKSTSCLFSSTGVTDPAMSIYRENRIQESEFRIQEKSTSCLFSSTGVAPLAMRIYRENSRQSAVGSRQLMSGPFSCPGVTPLRHEHLLYTTLIRLQCSAGFFKNGLP